jgi:hypothetical protein
MSSVSVHSAGDFTPSEVSRYWKDRLSGMLQQGNEWRYYCELHGGTRDSFSVNGQNGLWYCHSKCGRGGYHSIPICCAFRCSSDTGL